jgi:hypothetical protein
VNPVATLFKNVLLLGSILISAIALVGSIIGFLGFGGRGVLSALIGAAMATVFVSLTATSVWFGSRLSLAGFFAIVLGGWILKLVLFLILVVLLRNSDFIVGGVIFFTLVSAVLGSLAVDAWVFTRSRIPLIQGE